MAHTPINPPGSPPPMAPYSPAVKVGNVVYVSGVVPMDQEGKTASPGDCAAQTRHVLETIKTLVEAAGGTMADIAFNHVFLSDLKNYQAMNGVYREYFPKDPPARYCIRADLVRPDFLVEIASVAHLKG
ncbi:MAG TPA: pyrimidine utilization protein C [Burkholderiales bacterium]|nr:pyrimidine utilization protein C [Burkholderiales bacterium]